MEGKPAILIMEIEVDPADEAEINDWYHRVHLPELCAIPGIRSGRRFRVEGGTPRYVAVYELDDPGVVEGEAFKAWRAASVETSRMAARFVSLRRTLAVEVARSGRPGESSLDAQLNPRLAVGDAEAIMDERRRESEAVAEGLSIRRESYGPHPRERFLVASSGSAAPPGRPAVIYIHGGYWRAGAPEDNLLLAPAIESLGALPIFLGYPLCPQTRLPDVVESARRGVRAILERADELGFERGSVVLAGASAGAHLAARVLADPSLPEIRGALLLTGIYDLTPVPLLTVNAEIGLSGEDAAEQSPLVLPYRPVRSVFAVGSLEPPLWRSQTYAMAALARAAGSRVSLVEAPGRHHFDLVLELTQPGSALRRALADLLTAPNGS